MQALQTVSPALAFLDVDYRGDQAIAACLLADAWDAPSPHSERIARIPLAHVAPYTPGAFYLRELPCLLAVLTQLREALACVVVDGYVYLDRDGRPGLGARLHEALGGQTPVVGIAKTRFGDGSFAVPVRRGTSTKPLWITAVGMNPTTAAEQVRTMHGAHRIPTLLARVDRLCRSAA